MSTALSLGPVSNDSLILILSREASSRFLVRSVQMVSGDMRNSHCFTSGRSIQSAFVPEFGRSVLALLDAEDAEQQIFEKPDFSFSLPGIGISGLRIDFRPEDLPDGALRLQFRRIVGDVTRVLDYERSVEVPSATVRERIAVEVLQDIVSPIFDMLSFAAGSSDKIVHQHSRSLQARLNRLTEQQEEIEFYTGLLKRYVSGCKEDAAEGARKKDDEEKYVMGTSRS